MKDTSVLSAAKKIGFFLTFLCSRLKGLDDD